MIYNVCYTFLYSYILASVPALHAAGYSVLHTIRPLALSHAKKRQIAHNHSYKREALELN